jgi:hypothetical protein
MGYFPAQEIQSAAEFLIHFIKESPDERVQMSLLYDGTDKTHSNLLEWLDFADDHYSPEVAIDLAAFQLEEAGLIEITELTNRLPDDEPDYLMELTDEGTDFLKREQRLVCRGMDL